MSAESHTPFSATQKKQRGERDHHICQSRHRKIGRDESLSFPSKTIRRSDTAEIDPWRKSSPWLRWWSWTSKVHVLKFPAKTFFIWQKIWRKLAWKEQRFFFFFRPQKYCFAQKKRGGEKIFSLFFSLDFPRKKGGENNMGVRLSVLGCECVCGKTLSIPPPHKREGEEGKTLPLSLPVSPPLLPFPKGPVNKVKDFYPAFFLGGGKLCVSCGYFPKIRSCGDDVVLETKWPCLSAHSRYFAVHLLISRKHGTYFSIAVKYFIVKVNIPVDCCRWIDPNPCRYPSESHAAHMKVFEYLLLVRSMDCNVVHIPCTVLR